jgi:hypothetical protein
MEIQLISDELLGNLHKQASEMERLRVNFDLRTTSEDGSQRMLNVMEPGTRVPIHRHMNTTESVVCLEGCLDWMIYEELPNMDAGGPIHDGERAFDDSCFKEVARVRVCPREGLYGVQVPLGAWHSIEVYEPSTIFEAKDGKYGE